MKRTSILTAIFAMALLQANAQRARLLGVGGPPEVVDRIVRLFELNGGIGLATLGRRIGVDEVVLTRAYTALGEALGLGSALGGSATSLAAGGCFWPV